MGNGGSEEACPNLEWTSPNLSTNDASCLTHSIEIDGADFNNNPRTLRLGRNGEDGNLANNLSYLYMEPYHETEADSLISVVSDTSIIA